MSVLIKGMKMPDCCAGCPLLEYDDYATGKEHRCNALNVVMSWDDLPEGRRKDCPLTDEEDFPTGFFEKPRRHATEKKDLWEEQPTIEAEPVRHGKWIVWDEIIAGIYHTVSECSECGFTTDKMDREEMPYCPYCGARMDEE